MSRPTLRHPQHRVFVYGAITLYRRPFQSRSTNTMLLDVTGLVPFRSPLLGESRLISFPPPTEMFQFSGFALPHL